jgi:NAD(P)-dependent dehydrogenase (short-subunit alcohol dehydrogenase family)
MDMKIDGLRVLVTAGASGIGLATARAFAAEGARVVICDIDEKALAAVAASEPGFARVVCDVAEPVAVAKLFAAVTDTLGGLDALINNAGVAGPTARCEEVTLDDWQRTLAVNLTGQFLCAQHAIPLLRRAQTQASRISRRQLGVSGIRCARPTLRRNGVWLASRSRSPASSAPLKSASTRSVPDWSRVRASKTC